MVSRTSKLMIINAVRQTESHNKRHEEGDMWSQRRLELEERRERQQRYHDDDLQHSFKSGGYLNEKPSGQQRSEKRSPSASTSNKWAAELMRYEESLGDERWGHGGYKELYPEEFDTEDKRRREHPTMCESKAKKRKKKRKPPDNDADTDDGLRGIFHQRATEPPPVYLLSDYDSSVESKSADNVTHSSRKKRRHKHMSSDDDSSKKHKKQKRHKKGKHKHSKRER